MTQRSMATVRHVKTGPWFVGSSQQVLVIAGDVSKYELDQPGEATQGAAAVAMLISADPAVVRVEEP